ncbi:MAG: alpha/beta hydrolase [Chloroflexota bacterium]
MTLDPQIAALLETMKGQPGIDTLTVEEARAMGVVTTDVEPVRRIQDLTIPGPSGSIPARLYVPEGRDPFPCLVYFHGGGWVLGSIEAHDGFCRLVANRGRCAVLSVGYRLAPENPFPAAINDAYAATAWLYESGEHLNIDSTRIAVGGDSAGGTLATVTCYLSRERGPQLAGQLLICPCTVIDYQCPSRSELADGPFMTSGELAWFYNHYVPNSSDRTDPRAAPLLNDDLSGLPPALILSAEYDPLRDEDRAYADRLREAGVPTIYSEYPGVIHNWVLFGLDIDAAVQGMNEIAAWLRSTLQTDDT